ncbi:MAG: S41 family peptidase [Microcoleaceae cyanobacterium]
MRQFSMNQQVGYYHHPTIHENNVVFVCEDDLWQVSKQGGPAVRLTANLGEVSSPFLSPDGTQLAFVGKEEGNQEVYWMPAVGGMAQRLTFLGSQVGVAGWSRDRQSIVFASNAKQPFRRIFKLYAIKPEGGLPQPLPWGLAHNISYGANGGVVLGRNTTDLARWKRYRGGTAGVIWIDPNDTGEFCHLLESWSGNLASPMWIGSRIFFTSDHAGIGNLYSCTPEGEDLQQHTRHRDYYVRHATTDGKCIVYQVGADLFWLDPETDRNQKIEIEFHSPQIQRQRKFVKSGEFLEDYALHPQGHSTVITTRGQSFTFGNWEGASTQIGKPEAVRYRLTRWLNDGQRLVTITDREGREGLEIYSPDNNVPLKQFPHLDLGRVVLLAVAPVGDRLALTNHRHELILVNLNTAEAQVCDRSAHLRIQGISWSPDGEWIAYGCADTQKTVSIKLFQVESGAVHRLTSPRFWDISPAFDPDGKFLYFLSVREFNPVYDRIYLDLNFPKGMRPYLISLQKDTLSPFVPQPKPLTKEKNADRTESHSDPHVDHSEEPTKLEIDLDGIENRIVRFPVPEGIYRQIQGLKGKVLWSSVPVEGSLEEDWAEIEPDSKAALEVYDFAEQKRDRVVSNLSSFKVGQDYETIIYRSKRRLWVGTLDLLKSKSDKKPLEEEDKPGRKTGWIDLNRVRVSLTPTVEWQQMFTEIWRLQQEQFWTENMSGVDWARVKDRYQPLLNRVTTRSEFSDLIWEMQGELGTSHAYEFGGDYRHPPSYKLGFLGADFSYDPATDAYRLEHIVQGDRWDEKKSSPLTQIGLNIQPGDLLLTIGGQRLNQHLSPEELLVHQAGTEVTLTFARTPAAEPQTITVKTLRHEMAARYREWVETNSQTIDQITQGRVGYVHIPDMGPRGYAEFHRYYMAEVYKEGLIIDVRYNSGGHVSQLLLEKLARQRIGYDISRWSQPAPYPDDAPFGPMIALTNEYAGSDGDIFSHCFKLMNLGPLVGTRTWGGVIGISPRHSMADGTLVTQPEFSFWFQDVGWRVENYGTDPDIEVEIKPQDWATGKDPQLEKALELILAKLDQNPSRLPDFRDRPYLALPELS